MIDSELGIYHEEANLSDDDENDKNEEEVAFLNVGRERFTSDRRQIGGLMLVLGTCATFQPLAAIASLTGVDDDGSGNSLSTLETVTLASGVLQFLFGTLAMVVGYLSLVHDYGDSRLTGGLIIFTQLAWMPFITGMVGVGQAASAPFTFDTRRTVSNGTVLLEEYVVNPFIPQEYVPNEMDVKFFGAMGILGIMAYGTGFLGSLGFTEFAQYSFDVAKPTHRDARYYRGRLLFYSFVLALAGVSQLLLGAYVLFQFGGGPLSPSVGVAMYRVYFPEISVAIGGVQLLVGYLGIARYLNYLPVGPNNDEMQGAAFLGWFLQLVLQYIVQISYGSGDENAASLTSLALLSLGMNLMPPYLDYKMRTTPYFLTNEYYGISANGVKAIDTRTEHLSPRSEAEIVDIPSGDENDHLLAMNLLEQPEDPSQLEELVPTVESDEDKEQLVETPLQYQRNLEIEDQTAVEAQHYDQDHDHTTTDARNVDLPSNNPDQDQILSRDQNEEEHVIVIEETVDQPPDDEKLGEKTSTANNDKNDEEEEVIVVEEYVDYPEEFPDDGTPPQSNKSLGVDAADAWGNASTDTSLSPLEEEDTERILAEDNDDDDDLNAVPHIPHDNKEVPDREESSVDMDSEEGMQEPSFVMSEDSFPSDDTATLEAKINRLQEDLRSDTNMESFMNALL
ncbi:MAG: hypothetical protein SGILL_000098 [Bacillariaceae sp.]